MRIVTVVDEFRILYLDKDRDPNSTIARTIPRWGSVKLEYFRLIETVQPIFKARVFHRLANHLVFVKTTYRRDGVEVKTSYNSYPLDKLVKLETTGLNLRPFRENRRLTGVWSLSLSLGVFPQKLWETADQPGKTGFLAAIAFEDISEASRTWEVEGFEGDTTETDETGMFRSEEQAQEIIESTERINLRDV